MISFQPTKDEIAFAEIADKFAREVLRPSMRDAEATKQIPQKIIKELADLGFLTMEEPESIGGLALPLTTQVQVYRALAFGDLGMVQGLPGLNDGASFLRILSDIKTLDIDEADTIAYISACEDEAFSTLELQQNQVTGTSLPVRLAKIATHFLIATKNELDETMLLLIPYQAGKQEVDGESYLGLSNAQIGTVTFDQTLTDENIIAVGEEAERIIKEAEARIHVLQAAKQVGIMGAAIEYATEYTATRKAFGQEIAKFQAVSFRISKMTIEKQVTQNFVLEAANAIDEAHSQAHQKALKTIYQAHKAVRYVTDSGVQLLGGHGFVQEYPAEKWMRDAQAQVILYGSERGFKQSYGAELLGLEEKVVNR